MSKSKLKGKDLRKINYRSDRAKSLAIDIVHKDFKHLSKVEKLYLLENVLLDPDKYLDHASFAPLAQALIGKVETQKGFEYALCNEAKAFKVYGRKQINPDTISQMELAMRLPVTVAGALMPDAHTGYGLPIGGVLAAENAVIPYGVGLDIGCRMSLTIFDASAGFIKRNAYQIKQALLEHTYFGIGKMDSPDTDHEILDSPAFDSTELLKGLHGKARNQLGSSGSGNHFVEFGIVELEDGNRFGLPGGEYTGLLAHSGSRGMGAEIAGHYTKLAMEKCMLPKGAQHLAWLDLNSEEGQGYWIAMNLAGAYARACHDVIHERLAKVLGLKSLQRIENHHNFAWKEVHEGKEVIVHRKGVTPADEDQLGIIPATMIDPGYIVSGRSDIASLNSASHGAGRKMSRKKARESITGSELKKMLKQHGVSLIGGGVDEAPMAYKNLEEVMSCQKDLVKTEGKFIPRIVRMDKH